MTDRLSLSLLFGFVFLTACSYRSRGAHGRSEVPLAQQTSVAKFELPTSWVHTDSEAPEMKLSLAPGGAFTFHGGYTYWNPGKWAFDQIRMELSLYIPKMNQKDFQFMVEQADREKISSSNLLTRSITYKLSPSDPVFYFRGFAFTPTPIGREAPSTIKMDLNSAREKNILSDVIGYMDIPWGVSADQVMKIIDPKNPEGYGYARGSGRYAFSFDSHVRLGSLYNTVEFTFSPDKAHLKGVQLISPWDNVKKNEFELASRACLKELTSKFGNPAYVTNYEFGAGRFVIRQWKFRTTNIEFGEFLSDSESPDVRDTSSRFAVIYQPTKTKSKWDIRNFLYPYQDKTTGKMDWENESLVSG